MIASVNRIFLRRSGTLNALTKALSTVARFYRSGDDLGGASGVLDLAACGLGERLRTHRELGGELPSRKHLDGSPLADEPGCEHAGRVRRSARERRREPVDVHDRVLDAVGVVEALELRDPADQRDLPALETELGVVPREIALRPAAGGLALTGCLAAADAFARLRRALGGPQVMELHPDPSSTSTRWRTFSIMPRISGRSSLTTESFIRWRPSARIVAF